MTNTSTIDPSLKKTKEAHRKVFQTICKYGLLVITIRLLTNLWFGNGWVPAVADILTGIAVLVSYVLSFRLKDYTIIIWPFIIITQISSFFLWFGMGGLRGPAIAFNLTITFIYLLVDVKKRYGMIGGFVMATTLANIILEYYFPEWVIPYESSFAQSLDTAVIFICMIVTVTLVSRLIVQRYDAEKTLAFEKTVALEKLQQKEKAKKKLLDQLKELQTNSFLGEHIQEGPQQLLALLIETTGSQAGFMIKTVSSEGEGRTLQVIALRNAQAALSEALLAEPSYWTCSQGINSLEELFEQAVAQRTPLVIDMTPALQNELAQLVCFPVLYDNEVIGMMAIAKKNNYEDNLSELVAPFLPTCGNVLRNIRLQRRQKEYETALTASKEVAEAAVLAKNQLFTNISHELRTPLSLVVGPVSALLQNESTNGLSTDGRESLEMVLRNSKKMLQYINDIMDLAKLNSSTLELQLHDNHLYTFIQSIYQGFELQKRYREVEYQLLYEANKELVVQFDSKKMEKIINNLLSNAFKYTPNGGRICLLVREEGEFVHVEVSDTGVGIGADELPHIFERFYQSKNAQQISAKGTGIGLALAQELAQLHDFHLEIESTLNKGTRLFFKMPKEAAAVSPAQIALKAGLPELSERDPQKPSILVVEDNYDMAAFVKLVLQNDYNIDLAANGAIGWETLNKQQQRYDLVITDLMMPQMDGFELLRHIKGSSWGTSMPVIVLTARADSKSKLEALTIGIDEYLTKPFSVEELTIHVKNLIQNAQVRQQVAQEIESDTNTAIEAIPEETVEHAPVKEQRMTVIEREKIDKAKQVVLEQLDNTEFSVDDLARALITSKRQLYRFMQLNTGLTPLKFINEIRLQEARRMLEEGLCSTVKEVSYSIGFMSTRHFSKTYSNRFGKKPSEYLR